MISTSTLLSIFCHNDFLNRAEIRLICCSHSGQNTQAAASYRSSLGLPCPHLYADVGAEIC